MPSPELNSMINKIQDEIDSIVELSSNRVKSGNLISALVLYKLFLLMQKSQYYKPIYRELFEKEYDRRDDDYKKNLQNLLDAAISIDNLSIASGIESILGESYIEQRGANSAFAVALRSSRSLHNMIVRITGDIVEATTENYNEDGYLLANPDIQQAIKQGWLKSGLYHFDNHRHERRNIVVFEGVRHE